jgi:hypothetical protein|tara:strand:- start:893 stop:1189 length:297 start_codon:yes stop_codon:yes gene_type:complete
MVLFEQFSLAELKDIIRYIQKKYFMLESVTIYHLNKYDLIVLLRNSTLFDESHPKKLIINVVRGDPVELEPIGINKHYKGSLLKGGITITKKNIKLIF